jgi:hypothetical protein
MRALARRSRPARRYSAATTLRATPYSQAVGAARSGRSGVDRRQEYIRGQVRREIWVSHTPRQELLDRPNVLAIEVIEGDRVVGNARQLARVF